MVSKAERKELPHQLEMELFQGNAVDWSIPIHVHIPGPITVVVMW